VEEEVLAEHMTTQRHTEGGRKTGEEERKGRKGRRRLPSSPAYSILYIYYTSLQKPGISSSLFIYGLCRA